MLVYCVLFFFRNNFFSFSDTSTDYSLVLDKELLESKYKSLRLAAVDHVQCCLVSGACQPSMFSCTVLFGIIRVYCFNGTICTLQY